MRQPILLLLFAFGALRAGAQQRDLDFFLTNALANNPILQDLQNQVAASRIDSLRLRASLGPQLNANAAGLLAPAFGGWGYDYALTNGGLATAVVSASQPIVGRENSAAQAENITLQARAAQNSAKTTAQDLRRSITAQYLTAYGDRQQADFNRSTLDLLHREAAVLKQLTETGVYRQTDYLIFLTTVQQQELLVQQLDNQWRNDLSALNYQCGITDTAAATLADPALALQQPPQPSESAFFESYRLDSLTLRNNDALIDFSYRPRASIVADAGFNSAFTSKGYRNFGVSAGVSLTVPIYDGRQRRLQHDKTAIAEHTRVGYARYFEQQYQQQIALLNQQLNQADQLIDQTAAQIKYSRTLLEANGKLLHTGDVRIADYLLALNTYLSAQNLLTQQQTARLQIINQLNYWSLK